jgi:hypothetical protein
MTAATWRAAPKTALNLLSATAGPAGVVVGRDHSGTIAPVRLLRPEATRVALVGGSWAARLLVFRCLAVGALVEVTTAAPPRWSALADAAGAGPRLTVLRAGEFREPPASMGSLQPLVHVNDVGLGRPVDRPALGPWHTSMTVLPVLTPHTAATVGEANVVLLQRLGPEEADICVSTLRLPGATSVKLQQMHDDMLVVVVAGVPRYLWFATTSVEHEILGPAQRGERGVA